MIFFKYYLPKLTIKTYILILYSEMSETLTNNTADQASITTNGTFDNEPERVENSTVNTDTFMDELDSLVDQPIENEESSAIENGGREEPKKVENTKNVDIDEFLGELDSLIDEEPSTLPGLETLLDVTSPELVLDQPVLMTELESKQVLELSEPVLEQPVLTEIVKVPESLKLSEPAQQDVVDFESCNEKFKNENFTLSTNGLENTATKIKDGKLHLPIFFGFIPYDNFQIGTFQS